MRIGEFDMYNANTKQEKFDNFWDDFFMIRGEKSENKNEEFTSIWDSFVTEEELESVFASINNNEPQENDLLIFDKEPDKQEILIQSDMTELDDEVIVNYKDEIFLEEESKLSDLLLQTLEQLEEQDANEDSVEVIIQKDDLSTKELAEYALVNNLVSNEIILDVAQELLDIGKINIEELAIVLFNTNTVTLEAIAKALYEINTISEAQLINYLMSNDVISKSEIAEILYTNNKISEEEIIKEMSVIDYDLTQSKVLQSESSNLAIDFVDNFYRMYNESDTFVDFEFLFYNYFKTEIKNIIIQLNQETSNIQYDLSHQVCENNDLKNKNKKLESLVKQYIADNQKVNELLALADKKNTAIMQELIDMRENYKHQETLMTILEKRILKDR